MAQVAQKQREVAEEGTLNKVESKQFVKRMLAVGISNIIYLRNLFPESAFADRRFEDLRLKILKEKDHEGAGRIVQWMKGVYDALDREYLRALVFAIVSDVENPESVIESYTFCFTYDDGKVQASMSMGDGGSKTAIPTKSETTESAKRFLRNLTLLTTSMDNLPSNVFMTIRLLYYDKVTPTEYQPPGFIEAIGKDTLGFIVDNLRIKLGHVITPYTNMKIRVRAAKSQFESDEKTKKPDLEVDDSQLTVDDEPINENMKAILKSQLKEKDYEVSCLGDGSEREDLTEASMEEVQEDLGVRCPCLDPDDDGLMVLCSKCNYWQHAICFCLYDDTCMPETHICHLCSDKYKDICTDPRLTGLAKEQQQEMCAFRRTLHSCLDKRDISTSMIATNLSSSHTLSRKMMAMLLEERIVSSKNHSKLKSIDQAQLKRVYDRMIVHVCNNLQLQRGDDINLDVDDSSLMSSPSAQGRKRRAAHVNEDSDNQVTVTGRQPTPLSSQSSAFVFRSNTEQPNEVPARKKRKHSRGVSTCRRRR